MSEAVLYKSDYALQYDMLTSVFQTENILIVNGDMIVQNPLEEIKKVETFIGLPSFFAEDHFVYPKEKGIFPCFKLGKKTNCMKGDKGREHPPLSQETLSYLKNYFQTRMDKFEQLTRVAFKM